MSSKIATITENHVLLGKKLIAEFVPSTPSGIDEEPQKINSAGKNKWIDLLRYLLAITSKNLKFRDHTEDIRSNGTTKNIL